MTKFRLVLVLLCLGILGALPFIISQPNPDSGSAQAAVQPQTAVQRQMAAEKADGGMRAEIAVLLYRSEKLALAGEYKQAMAIVDELQPVPGKTPHEEKMIEQMRQFILAREGAFTDRQAR
jgi:hypothetical protein